MTAHFTSNELIFVITFSLFLQNDIVWGRIKVKAIARHGKLLKMLFTQMQNSAWGRR